PDDAVLRAEPRAVEGKVERLVRVDRQIPAVRAQDVLADQGGVGRGPGADEEEPVAGRGARREPAGLRVVPAGHPNKRIGLPLDRVVHVVWVARALFVRPGRLSPDRIVETLTWLRESTRRSHRAPVRPGCAPGQ